MDCDYNGNLVFIPVVIVVHVLPSLDALKRMLNLNQPLPKAAVATEPVWKVSRYQSA